MTPAASDAPVASGDPHRFIVTRMHGSRAGTGAASSDPASPIGRERLRRLAQAQVAMFGGLRRFSHVALLAGALLIVGIAVLRGLSAPLYVIGAWLLGTTLAVWSLQRAPRDERNQVPLFTLLLPLLSYALLPWLAPPPLRAPLALLSCLAGVFQVAACAALHRHAWIGALMLPPVIVASILVQPLDTLTRALWIVTALMAGFIGIAATQLRRRNWLRTTETEIETALRASELSAQLDIERRRAMEMSRFLAIASHDLRQPVHALALFSATLERRLEGSPDEPLARNQSRAVDSLERSFNALFDISKLDAGTVEPTIEAFALRDVFRRLQMHFGGQAELAGLGLRLAPAGRSVVSDAQLLERILANLIQNALRHTVRGGVAVVARRGAAGTVHVEVWDTGCGIEPSELPEIFREFYQIGNRAGRGRKGGLGMGLAIVKRLVTLLGHGLEIRSAPGRGTVVRVVVPEADDFMSLADASAPDTRPMPMSATHVVMVIDDEESIREGLRLLLQEWGLHVVTAADAAQAEQMAIGLEGAIDLVLTDLHLGDGPDGLQALRTLRRICARRVPAIVITGDIARADPTASPSSQPQAAEETGTQPGIPLDDPVLIKPVQPARLFEAVRAALQ